MNEDRHNQFLTNIFKEKVMGKNLREWPRTAFIKNMEEEMDLVSYSYLKKTEMEREIYSTRRGF